MFAFNDYLYMFGGSNGNFGSGSSILATGVFASMGTNPPPNENLLGGTGSSFSSSPNGKYFY